MNVDLVLDLQFPLHLAESSTGSLLGILICPCR